MLRLRLAVCKGNPRLLNLLHLLSPIPSRYKRINILPRLLLLAILARRPLENPALPMDFLTARWAALDEIADGPHLLPLANHIGSRNVYPYGRGFPSIQIGAKCDANRQKLNVIVISISACACASAAVSRARVASAGEAARGGVWSWSPLVRQLQ